MTTERARRLDDEGEIVTRDEKMYAVRVECDGDRGRTSGEASSEVCERDASAGEDEAREWICRICLDKSRASDDSTGFKNSMELLDLGCRCREDASRAHRSCLVRWFAPRARGCARGLALRPDWTLSWSVTCEICAHDLASERVCEIIRACKRALRTNAKRHSAPPEILSASAARSRRDSLDSACAS